MNLNENAYAGETAQALKTDDYVDTNATKNATTTAVCDFPHYTVDLPDLSGISYGNTTTSYDLLDRAKQYASLGWAVCPLHGMVGSQCSCTHPDCGCVGKHPVTWDGLRSATTDETRIEAWWQSYNFLNVGVVTGEISGIFVIDIDIKPDKRGDLSLAQLVANHGELPKTVEAITGSGGRHLVFKHPGFNVGNKQNSKMLGDGIDVRGDGGYIVAPGSKHKSGRTYEWKEGHAPGDVAVADAPAWLLSLLTAKPEAGVAEIVPVTVSAGPVDKSELLKAARRYLSKCDPAIEGSGGDADTFNLAGHLHAFQYDDGTRLTVDEITNVMMEDWNLGCKPPWKKAELRKKVESAVNNGTPRAAKIIEFPRQDVGPAKQEIYECTDLGNALRFVRDHGGDVRYAMGYGWMFWNGTHWEMDQTKEIERKAKTTVKRIGGETQSVTSESKVNDLLKWALVSQNVNRLDAMVKLASSEAKIIIKSDRLNSDPMLLNCLNGTIDLKSGQLREHRREDLITKVCPVNYDENALCPEWMKLLDLVTAGNVELQSYLQRAVGYSITGDTGEQCLFFLYGFGKNGKSTFMNTISSLLGHDAGYAGKAGADSIMAKAADRSIRNDLARLAGYRFIVTSELEQNRRWDEATVKEMTGGDRIKACFKYKEEFEFSPVWKLWCYGNHRPNVRGNDIGFWRRMQLIPFTVEIPESKRISQTKIAEMLKAEWPGIMAWMVRGCLEWKKNGKLEKCAVVEGATKEYKAESDTVAQFVEERLVTDFTNARVKHKDVYKDYAVWAKEEGLNYVMTSRDLVKQLRERGFTSVVSHGQATWEGITLAHNQFGQRKAA